MMQTIFSARQSAAARFLSTFTVFAAVSGCALATAGCAGNMAFPDTTTQGSTITIAGNLHGGQQPVTGSHVHVMQAASTGYGNASTALMTANGTTILTDAIGPYVATDSLGNFSVSGDYTCTSGTQVYLLATQGNPGLGTGGNNPALALMAGLGACPATGNFATAVPYVFINEVSTVATAYALAGFFTDATHLASSGTTLATTGITNAGKNIAQLESIATGAALTTTPNTLGTVPQAEINTLANIIAGCINTSGTGAPCTTLFANATSSAGVPTDTATAMINIAHSPGKNVSTLIALSSTTAPFQPSLSSLNDFSLAIQYVPATSLFSVSGTKGDTGSNGSIAVDASGNIWGPGNGFTSVVEISPLGATLKTMTLHASAAVTGSYAKPLNITVSPTGTIWAADYQLAYALPTASAFTVVTDASANYAGVELATAFDSNNNVWTGNNYPASFGEFSSTGTLLVTTGYEPGGFAPLTSPQTYPSNVFSVAVDGLNHVWGLCNQCSGSAQTPDAAEISSNGTAVSGSTGDTASTLGYPSWVAIDRNNNAWISSFNGYFTEYSSTSTLLSGSGYPTSGAISGGLNTVAVDGNNIIWGGGVNSYYGALYAVNSSGVLQSPTTGYQAPGPASSSFYGVSSIAVDGSGDIWALDYNGGLHETIGIATPVVTPITSSSLGVRP